MDTARVMPGLISTTPRPPAISPRLSPIAQNFDAHLLRQKNRKISLLLSAQS